MGVGPSKQPSSRTATFGHQQAADRPNRLSLDLPALHGIMTSRAALGGTSDERARFAEGKTIAVKCGQPFAVLCRPRRQRV